MFWRKVARARGFGVRGSTVRRDFGGIRARSDDERSASEQPASGRGGSTRTRPIITRTQLLPLLSSFFPHACVQHARASPTLIIIIFVASSSLLFLLWFLWSPSSSFTRTEGLFDFLLNFTFYRLKVIAGLMFVYATARSKRAVCLNFKNCSFNWLTTRYQSFRFFFKQCGLQIFEERT